MDKISMKDLINIVNGFKLEAMQESLKIQGYDGNWNYDEYMHGMYNGMELMLAIVEGREPIYREKPKEWLKDKEVNIEILSELKHGYIT